MSDSPSARRILGDALHAKPQTQDEAYAELVRILREPTDGTGPRVTQGMPFVQNAQGSRTRRPLHPFYGGPAVGVAIVVVGLAARWAGLW